MELSWYGRGDVAAQLGGEFHSRRLTLRASQVGALPAEQLGRWTTKRRMGIVMSLLEEPELDALITGESRFEELPEIMLRLADDPRGELCHRINYS